jgi:hypothetical protein
LNASHCEISGYGFCDWKIAVLGGRRFVKKAVMKKEKSTRRQKSGMKDEGGGRMASEFV